MRFPLEVVRRIRATVGDDFIVIFRIAAMDMLQGGMSWDEVAQLARELEGWREHHLYPLCMARGQRITDYGAARLYPGDSECGSQYPGDYFEPH